VQKVIRHLPCTDQEKNRATSTGRARFPSRDCSRSTSVKRESNFTRQI